MSLMDTTIVEYSSPHTNGIEDNIGDVDIREISLNCTDDNVT